MTRTIDLGDELTVEIEVDGDFLHVTQNTSDCNNEDVVTVPLDKAANLAEAIEEATYEHCEDPITDEWLLAIGGKPGTAPEGRAFYDFLINVEFSKGATSLRIHSPDERHGDCITDLYDTEDWRGVGIVNWPKTRGDVRRLCKALGVQLTDSP